jgi:hypothetical protein
MWSTWHSGAGRSQVGCVQRWSRTSIARRVAPVKNRAFSLTSIRGRGENTMRSNSATSSQGTSDPGVRTLPASVAQIRPESVS